MSHGGVVIGKSWICRGRTATYAAGGDGFRRATWRQERSDRPGRRDRASAGAARRHARAGDARDRRAGSDYALLDSGNGEKLERYGRYRIVRPEEQAIWTPRRPAAEWDAADATFVGIGDDEADGRWRYRKPLGETWPIAYDGVAFLGRFTTFRHVGVFPEQVTHWEWIKDRIDAARPAREGPQPLRLHRHRLADRGPGRRRGHPHRCVEEGDRLGAREPGARRTSATADPLDLRRRDEIRRARGAARQPLRRHHPRPAEVRARAEGRGVGHLHRPAADCCAPAARSSPTTPLFLILTAYSIRASFLSIDELAAECLAGRGGLLEVGRAGAARAGRRAGAVDVAVQPVVARWLSGRESAGAGRGEAHHQPRQPDRQGHPRPGARARTARRAGSSSPRG